MYDGSEEKEMFILNYVFNVKSDKKGKHLVDEAHDAWGRFIWYCSEGEDLGKAN
jgi:hypothetical protein